MRCLGLLACLLIACDATPDATPDGGPVEDGSVPFDAARGDASLGPSGGLTGRVTAPDRPFTAAGFTGEILRRPAPGIEVEAVSTDETVWGRARTDVDGRFTLPPAPPGSWRLRARAQVVWGGPSVDVRDANGRPYVIEGPEIKGEVGEVSLDVDGRAGAVFHILEEARRGLEAVVEAVGPTDVRLTYRWQAGVAWPCGSCYLPDTVLLGGGLEDPDEFDDAIILHEQGHWFIARFSADDSPGGPHRNRLVSPVLAYGEGVAYFFAALVLQDPLVLDTFIDSVRAVDLEAVTINGEADPALRGTTSGTLTGDLREELVAGILWDVFDPPTPTEPFDRVALGRAGMFEVLTDVFGADPPDGGARGIDLADWLEHLACSLGPTDVQALADERAYPWTPQLGCGKGRIEPPFTLTTRAGGVWLHAPAGQSLRVRINEKSQWIQCIVPCRVADAHPDAQIVVSAPHQRWAGRSWLGARRLARLAGGRVVGDVRILPARGGMLSAPMESP